MVNTFLVHPDFRASAATLDRQRLGKQRVEAYQLLVLLTAIDYVAGFLGQTIPHSSSLLVKRQWLKQLDLLYKQQSWQLIYDTKSQVFTVEAVPLSGKHKPLGWINHLITGLWLGYNTALMAYINAHISEWLARGYVNNMTTYEVPQSYPRPDWTYSVAFHNSHKAALLAKELGQNNRQQPEPAWYQLKAEFAGIYPQIEYMWWPDGSADVGDISNTEIIYQDSVKPSRKKASKRQ